MRVFFLKKANADTRLEEKKPFPLPAYPPIYRRGLTCYCMTTKSCSHRGIVPCNSPKEWPT